jgi:hypothetical protein
MTSELFSFGWVLIKWLIVWYDAAAYSTPRALMIAFSKIIDENGGIL